MGKLTYTTDYRNKLQAQVRQVWGSLLSLAYPWCFTVHALSTLGALIPSQLIPKEALL